LARVAYSLYGDNTVANQQLRELFLSALPALDELSSGAMSSAAVQYSVCALKEAVRR